MINNSEYLLAATTTGCYITVSTDIEIDVYQDSQLITRVRDHNSAKIKIQPYLEYTFIPHSLGMFTFEIAHGTFNQEEGNHYYGGSGGFQIVATSDYAVAYINFVMN